MTGPTREPGITPAMILESRAAFHSTAKLLEEVALQKLEGKVNARDRKLLEKVVRDARHVMRRAKP